MEKYPALEEMAVICSLCNDSGVDYNEVNISIFLNLSKLSSIALSMKKTKKRPAHTIFSLAFFSCMGRDD